MKMKPKSCGCQMCRWVKGGEKTQPGVREMEERAFRRRQHVLEKRAILDEEQDFDAVPYGDYHA